MMPPHRKRLCRIETQQQARFLTFSCFRRLLLFRNPSIRDAFAQQLEHVHQRGAFQLQAWVIMREHVQLLLVPSLPAWTVPAILRSLKTPFARRVIRRWTQLDAPVLGRIDDREHLRFWQRGGGYDRNIESPDEWREKLNYINNNPVSKGLVASPANWRWSSARWYAGCRDGFVTIDGIVSDV